MRPYDLRDEKGTSDGYYEIIEREVVQVEQILTKELKRYAKEYRIYIGKRGWEKPRSMIEYELELVMYGAISRHYEEIVGYEMDWEELIDVLSAESEYSEEYDRLKNWGKFWEDKDQPGLEEAIWRAIKGIRIVGDKYLNPFLSETKEFQADMVEHGTERKDFCLISRGMDMYYINMFGAEMMNRVYRDEFAKTKERYVFLPGCMAEKKEKCPAEKDKVGAKCAHCTEGCAISEISQMTSKIGTKTRIMYHESEITKSIVEKPGKTGIIGIACVLNLLSGGWKAKRLGYVPQCVLLNYPGCQKHWDREGQGILTCTNNKKIQDILQEGV